MGLTNPELLMGDGLLLNFFGLSCGYIPDNFEPMKAICQRLAVLIVLLWFWTCLAEPQERVVVLSPHSLAIRFEFSVAFEKWHKKHYGTPASVEWRDLGGTTDAMKFVQSEFAKKPDGIGIDCFFGGGLEPFLLFADKNLAEPYQPPAEILEGIPRSLSGMDLYDSKYRWFGAALSSFGILQNLRVQQMAGLPLAKKWEDLGRPELQGWVGIGDPRNSGTMNSMFEALLQAFGWEKGWSVIMRIGGNARKVDRISTATAKDVTLGESAYGFAIDFYAITQIGVAGATNMTFIRPDDFVAVNPDGICLLKGAPHPVLARRFIDFVLSESGQKLWFLPLGHPEGAQQYYIERMTVRPDFYQKYQGISHITFSPFDMRQGFRYDNKLARTRREVVAALIGALVADTHRECQAAWKAVIKRGMRSEEVAEFTRPPFDAAEALRLATSREWEKPSFRNLKQIEWQSWAQAKYKKLRQGLD